MSQPAVVRLTKFALSSVLLSAIAGIYLQPLLLDWRAPCLLLFSALQAAFACAFPRQALVLAGTSLLIFPFFAGGALSIVLCGWALGAKTRIYFWPTRSSNTLNRATQLSSLAAGGICLAVCLSGVKPLLAAADLTLFSAIVRQGGWLSLYYYGKTQLSSWLEVPRLCAGYLLALSLFKTCCELPPGRESRFPAAGFIFGLSIGVAIALIVFVAQYLDLHPIYSLNRGAFWQMTGRYSATFSDPNAFGVMAFLLGGLLWFLPREEFAKNTVLTARILVAIFLFCALWSGSRTMWLGLGLYGMLFLLYPAIKQAKGNRRIFTALAVILCAAAFLALGYPPLHALLIELPLPPGVHRLLQAVAWDRLQGVFDNRQLFLQLAYQLWQGEKLTGIGLGQFFFRQDQAARVLGIDLKGWRDNANNYYLQTLTEGGAIALVLLFFSFLVWAGAFNASGEGARAVFALRLKRLLFIFALLLFVGPHVNFEEVRYFLAMILALATVGLASEENSSTLVLTTRHWRSYLGLSVLLVLPYVTSFLEQASQSGVRGFYAIEGFGQPGEEVRWTASEAYFSLCLAPSEVRSISFRALRPGLENAPVELVISHFVAGEYRPLQKLSIATNEWQQSVLPGVSRRERYRLQVLTLWSPAGGRPPGDVRWLGVQVKWGEEFC